MEVEVVDSGEGPIMLPAGPMLRGNAAALHELVERRCQQGFRAILPVTFDDERATMSPRISGHGFQQAPVVAFQVFPGQQVHRVGNYPSKVLGPDVDSYNTAREVRPMSTWVWPCIKVLSSEDCTSCGHMPAIPPHLSRVTSPNRRGPMRDPALADEAVLKVCNIILQGLALLAQQDLPPEGR